MCSASVLHRKRDERLPTSLPRRDELGEQIRLRRDGEDQDTQTDKGRVTDGVDQDA